MKIGIWAPMTFEEAPPSPGEYESFFNACEDLGFSSIWVTDQFFHRTHLFDALTVLTWAAAHTRRIRLGSAVLLLALRHPVEVAMAAASLDALSGGRLTLGVSLGGSTRAYAGMGIDMRARVGRFVESVALLRHMWSGNGGSFRGRHFSIENAILMPAPLQAGGIPLLFGGQAEPVLKRAGELADGWIEDTRGDAQRFAEYWGRVRGYARAAGRDDARLESGKLLYLSVDNDRARARAVLEAHMISMYNSASGLDERAAVGSPEECAERIRPFSNAGVGTLMLGMPSLSVAHLERVAGEVVPLLGQG